MSVPSPVPTRILLDPETAPPGAEAEFNTDFSRHSVPYDEILSGGPPRDGILVQVGGEARAYPIQVLIWHKIVNDTLGGLPMLVSFCPLCNTAIAFERTFEGRVLDFGTTGRLRYSNLIMYDRQTESWWQQATGEAIVGESTGGQLTFYLAAMISWEEFRQNFPDGTVLSRETGYTRNYGQNPYAGYDNVDNPPLRWTTDTRRAPAPGTRADDRSGERRRGIPV